MADNWDEPAENGWGAPDEPGPPWTAPPKKTIHVNRAMGDDLTFSLTRIEGKPFGLYQDNPNQLAVEFHGTDKVTMYTQEPCRDPNAHRPLKGAVIVPWWLVWTSVISQALAAILLLTRG